jgi:hypothetical protein
LQPKQQMHLTSLVRSSAPVQNPNLKPVINCSWKFWTR